MTIEFCLPDLGEGLSESEIVAWHVSEGDHVVADQPLVSVETDKAIVEIPAPCSATVVRLCAAPGDTIEVGGMLVALDETGDADSADTGTVVGELRTDAPVDVAPNDTAPPPATPRVRAAPAVRSRARELGVTLDGVVGSGPGQSITLADVTRARQSSESAAAETSVASGPARNAAEDWLPLQGVRRAMARKMKRAGAEVVAATLTELADIHAWPADADPTLRLVRAVRAACDTVPALNAWYDPDRKARRLHEDLALGLAVDTPDGLIVPVLKLDADQRIDDASLRTRAHALVSAARQRTLTPTDLEAATFTLSNFGNLGGRHAALVVVPPQVAILGAGRIREDVVPDDGVPAIHRVLPLSLTFDHRVVTGGEAARFMAAVLAAVEL